jgi:hypothetical protein
MATLPAWPTYQQVPQVDGEIFLLPYTIGSCTAGWSTGIGSTVSTKYGRDFTSTQANRVWGSV